MIKHSVISGEISYPIGDRFTDNLPLVREMSAALHDILDEYYSDTKNVQFICKGSSGAIIAALVSGFLSPEIKQSIWITHIKKEGETSHSGNKIHAYPNSVVVVIDDFVETGGTILSIINTLNLVHISPDVLCITGYIFEDMIDEHFTHCICSY